MKAEATGDDVSTFVRTLRTELIFAKAASTSPMKVPAGAQRGGMMQPEWTRCMRRPTRRPSSFKLHYAARLPSISGRMIEKAVPHGRMHSVNQL